MQFIVYGSVIFAFILLIMAVITCGFLFALAIKELRKLF